MQILQSTYSLAAFLLLIALHFLSAFLPALWEKIIRYVNLALHIAFYCLLMCESIPLEETVLSYLLSLLCYLLSARLQDALAARRQEGREAKK